MEYDDLIRKRCSIRKFAQRSVEKEKLEQIVEAARIAPSAVDKQPWFFLIISKPENIQSLATAYKLPWLAKAPSAIVLLEDKNVSWKRPSDGRDFGDVDLGIAIYAIWLEATNLGLGAACLSFFDPDKIKALYGLPEYIEPIAIMPIGYPESEDLWKNRKPRKNMTDIAFWETLPKNLESVTSNTLSIQASADGKTFSKQEN